MKYQLKQYGVFHQKGDEPMKTIKNGIIHENPVFVLLLGLCSTLAITTKFENAYVMGICVTIVLVLSNFIVSLIHKLIPTSVKTPVYIIIIATLVTILELLLQYYAKDIYDVFGIYLPLIVVNCIILGRALAVASKQNVWKSTLDGVGIGIGYTLALMVVASIREVFGNNTITLMDSISTLTGYRAIYRIFPENNFIPMQILISPAGAFLVLGILMAIFNAVRKGGKHESN